jgi:hypothetical protein
MPSLHNKFFYFVLLAGSITSCVAYFLTDTEWTKHIAFTVLFVVSVTWAILLYSLQRQKIRTNQNKEHETLVHSELVRFPSIFSMIEKPIVEDLIIAKQEIQQIKSLINDGVRTLSNSFYGINSSVKEQHEIINDITATLPDHKAAQFASKLAMKTDIIQENIANAVRSLQFEDIAVQVADNSIQYLLNIENLLQYFHAHLDHVFDCNSQHSKAQDALQTFERSMNELRQHQLSPDRKAAKQQDLSAGEIELF